MVQLRFLVSWFGLATALFATILFAKDGSLVAALICAIIVAVMGAWGQWESDDDDDDDEETE